MIVDRRQFLHRSLGAAVVSPLMVDLASARAQTPAPAAARPAASPRKLVLDVYTKQLQWIRSADDVAQAAIEMVVHGVCPTVQAYPGHIDPAKVAQELPAFVTRIRSHGLRVTQFKGPEINEVTAAN